MYFIYKRILDILFALVGLIVLCPVAVCVKLAYLFSGDRAGIFYRQKRVGKNGKEFMIVKFRSMISGADDVLEEMLKQKEYKEEWEQSYKISDDPRITKVGKILRKTSLDELPQFINVIKGDMSLIGPRPLVPGELEAHDGLKLYQRLKPGITGWWACNGRSNVDYPERLKLEYYYIENCSLYLDILCIAKTILAVLKKEGAQ